MARKSRTIDLDDLRSRRDEILRLAAAHGAQNVRVFGSVAQGGAGPMSDVDILVDIPGDVGGFAYFGRLADLQQALSSVIGVDVDVIDAAGLRILRERILSFDHRDKSYIDNQRVFATLALRSGKLILRSASARSNAQISNCLSPGSDRELTASQPEPRFDLAAQRNS